MAASGAVVGVVLAGKGVLVLFRRGGFGMFMGRTRAVMMMFGMRSDMFAGLLSVRVRMRMSPRCQQTVSQVQQHGGKSDESEGST